MSHVESYSCVALALLYSTEMHPHKLIARFGALLSSLHVASSYVACLHDQNKSVFFSNQSELFHYFLNSSDSLDKSRLSKKATFVLIM